MEEEDGRGWKKGNVERALLGEQKHLFLSQQGRMDDGSALCSWKGKNQGMEHARAFEGSFGKFPFLVLLLEERKYLDDADHETEFVAPRRLQVTVE